MARMILMAEVKRGMIHYNIFCVCEVWLVSWRKGGLVSRGTTVEDARQFTIDRKEWRTLGRL